MQKEGVGLYLYCLYRGGNSLPVRGRTQTGIPELVGIDGDHKVFTLFKGDIHAALSLVPLQEFGPRALEQRMGDVEWVAPRVLIHERITEEFMAAYPVMPFRFGTIFASGDRIDELLKSNQAKIIRFFSEIGDKEEWEVKGYMNGSRLEGALKQGHPALGAVEATLREGSPGQAYLLKKKGDLAIKDGLNGKMAEITEEVFQGLLGHAVKGVSNKALQLEKGEEKKEMVLTAAYLVSKDDVRSFLGCVRDTEERYRRYGLTLSVTGPWPPYNFCPVLNQIVPS
ncbi:MAG: GvpL/GvpF family gas vesicle protein [Deltaproteobacteria bacterium]|nr:GvpL/GvpF family gas vesicle protein [Deltaproteobacteria bacterium]